MARFNLISALLVTTVLAGACKSTTDGGIEPDPDAGKAAPPAAIADTPAGAKAATATSCPVDRRQEASQYPQAMRKADYWLAKLADGDKVLLSPATIRSLNATNAKRPWAFQDVTQGDVGAAQRVDKEIAERNEWLMARLNSGKYVEVQKGDFSRAKRRIQDASRADEFRVLLKAHDLRCVPMRAALYKPPVDPRFDRNQCSGLHAGETIRVLRRSADEVWWYVHAGHSVGWLRSPQVTPPISIEQARAFRDHTPRLVATATRVEVTPSMTLRMGSSLPILERVEGDVVISLPTRKGLIRTRIRPPEGSSQGYLPFTRREVYERALAYLDHPYGWGERKEGQDCSRLMLDVFATFGLRLGRHSGEQAKAGVKVVELEGLDVATRRRTLRRSIEEGIVFAYMPGHIMLMLGQEAERTFAVSAIADFSEPCGPNSDRQVQVDRVVISDLAVGDGTKKRSFIKRLKRLAVFSAQ